MLTIFPTPQYLIQECLQMKQTLEYTHYTHKYTHLRILFSIVKEELNKTYEYSLFHKLSKTDNLPLLLPKFLINNKKVERVGSIKFLGVLLDEYLSWKEHIRDTKNKVSKSVGLL